MKNILSIFGLFLCVCLSTTSSTHIFAVNCNNPNYYCIDKIYCINGRVDVSASRGINHRSNRCRPEQECCYYEQQQPKEETCTAGKACVPKLYCVDGVIDTTAGNGINPFSNGPCSSENVCCSHARKRKCLGPQNVCVWKEICVNGVVDTAGINLINRRNNGKYCTVDQVCCSLPQTVQTPQKVDPVSCSQSSPVGPYVIGQAKLNEFPWVVQVYESWYTNESKTKVALSVGVLVSPKAVLTNAYKVCNSSETDLFVRAGEWDRREKIAPYVDRNVEKMIIHDNFDYSRSYFDIAILILKDKFELNSQINTICLPQPNMIFDNSLCVVAGWGKRQMTDEANSPILKKIQVRVLDRDTCREKMRVSLNHPLFELHSSLTCAGGITGNTCIGDIGAPLMCPVRGTNRYELAGLLAFNCGCNERDAPGGYVDVVGVLPWILEKIR